MQQKYLVGIIILLCGVLLFLYNEKNKNIIYYFYKNNCNNSETFTKLIKNIKKITYIDVDKPEFKELIDNFNIETVPEIIKLKKNGCRYIYNGDNNTYDITAWCLN